MDWFITYAQKVYGETDKIFSFGMLVYIFLTFASYWKKSRFGFEVDSWVIDFSMGLS